MSPLRYNWWDSEIANCIVYSTAVLGPLPKARYRQSSHWKSTVIEKPANIAVVNEGIAEREVLHIQILAFPNIQDSLSVNQFMEPLAEQIIDEDNDITEPSVVNCIKGILNIQLE